MKTLTALIISIFYIVYGASIDPAKVLLRAHIVHKFTKKFNTLTEKHPEKNCSINKKTFFPSITDLKIFQAQ